MTQTAARAFLSGKTRFAEWPGSARREGQKSKLKSPALRGAGGVDARVQPTLEDRMPVLRRKLLRRPGTTMNLRSKVRFKSQTVPPREVRERLQIGPGDHLRYVIDDSGVHVQTDMVRDSQRWFATFTEWASEADEPAYAHP
jgi:antitoxin PrlF